VYQIHLGAVPQVTPSHDEFAGQLTPNPARASVVTAMPVTVPPPQSVPQVPPTTPDLQCQRLFGAWAQQNPALMKCLNTTDVANIMNICRAAVGDPAKQAQAALDVQNYIGLACATRTPPVVTAPPVLVPAQPPQETQNPPITPPPQQDFPGGPPSGGDPPGATSAPPEKSLLQQWGPIVGIGLIAAMGLTYARKRALTKKRGKK
jgi:hypothetical protein